MTGFGHVTAIGRAVSVGLLFLDKPSGNYCPLWVSQAADQIKRLYDLFLKVDATQVEVNPFGETPDGQGTRAMKNDSYLLCTLCALCDLPRSLHVNVIFPHTDS